MEAGAGRVRSGLLFAGLVTAWGLNYLFVREGLGYSPPLWLAVGRSVVGCAGVGILLLARPSGRGHLDRRGQRDALLLGLPTTAAFFGLWFTAAGSILPGEASVVVYTFPLWVALFAFPVLGHRPTRLSAAAVALGFGGVVLVTEPWVGSAGVPWGAIGELLLGAISWAAGTVLYQRRFRGPELLEGNFYQLLGGSIALVAASVFLEPAAPAFSVPLAGVVLWLGLVGTAFAYSIWFSLLSRTRAPTLSAYVFLVPVVALAASSVLLQERLDLDQYLGVAMVLGSIYATSRGERPLEEPAA